MERWAEKNLALGIEALFGGSVPATKVGVRKMVVPNILHQNPKNTPVKRFANAVEGYDLEFWGTIFPEVGVQYHLRKISFPDDRRFRVDVYCKLFGRVGPFGMRRKLNFASKATFLISSRSARVEGARTIAENVAFVGCGLEQISNIRDGEIFVEGFERF